MLKCFNKAILLASLLFSVSSVYSMDFINPEVLIAFADIFKETIKSRLDVWL